MEALKPCPKCRSWQWLEVNCTVPRRVKCNNCGFHELESLWNGLKNWEELRSRIAQLEAVAEAAKCVLGTWDWLGGEQVDSLEKLSDALQAAGYGRE